MVTFLARFVVYIPPISFAERNSIQIVPKDLFLSEISSISCVEKCIQSGHCGQDCGLSQATRFVWSFRLLACLPN